MNHYATRALSAAVSLLLIGGWSFPASACEPGDKTGSMHCDSGGRWVNDAGGNLYGDSDLNWEADPDLNPIGDPEYGGDDY